MKQDSVFQRREKRNLDSGLRRNEAVGVYGLLRNEAGAVQDVLREDERMPEHICFSELPRVMVIQLGGARKFDLVLRNQRNLDSGLRRNEAITYRANSADQVRAHFQVIAS